MFSLFKKSDTIAFSDKVWKTRGIALSGLANLASESIKKSEKVVIISWFEDKKQSLEVYFAKNNVVYEPFSSGGTSAIKLLDATSLSSSITKISEWTSKGKVTLFFDGHYPLLQKESDVFEMLKSCNRNNLVISFCQSLDGGLMRYFGSEQILVLLEKLGWKDEDCIEHKMVSSSIARAREKLSKKVTNELICRNESDWFSKNAASL